MHHLLVLYQVCVLMVFKMHHILYKFHRYQQKMHHILYRFRRYQRKMHHMLHRFRRLQNKRTILHRVRRLQEKCTNPHRKEQTLEKTHHIAHRNRMTSKSAPSYTGLEKAHHSIQDPQTSGRGPTNKTQKTYAKQISTRKKPNFLR